MDPLPARGDFGGRAAPEFPQLWRKRDALPACALFERLPDGVFDGKTLRGGEALGQSLGFLRELNYACNLACLATHAHRAKSSPASGCFTATLHACKSQRSYLRAQNGAYAFAGFQSMERHICI